MTTSRLEAFSEGVLAIIITVMVFNIKAPAGDDLEGLLSVVPALLTYLMSFLYLGIYWNNHHNLLQAATRINGSALWGDLNLLFWLSLFPLTTSWMHQSRFSRLPVATYGVNLLLAGVAFKILQSCIILGEGSDSQIKQVIGRDFKGYASLIGYCAALGLAVVLPPLAITLYICVALVWIVPDKRFESLTIGKLTEF